MGENGQPVAQAPYEVSNLKWFTDTNRYMPRPFFGLTAQEIAADPAALDQVDTARGRRQRAAETASAVKAWVERGGNLVLTDEAVNGLADLGVVEKERPVARPGLPAVRQLHDLRPPAVGGPAPERAPARRVGHRRLRHPGRRREGGHDADDRRRHGRVEGRGRRDDRDHVDRRHRRGPGDRPKLDDGSLTSVGEVALGTGKVRIVGGALPTPTEENDHRFGLRNYGLTYSGLFLMENAIEHDAPALGTLRQGASPFGSTSALPESVRGKLPCVTRKTVRASRCAPGAPA